MGNLIHNMKSTANNIIHHLEYKIFVQTGDRLYAGVNSSVVITLFDENGNNSDPINLDSIFKNSYHNDKLNTFEVPNSHVSRLTENAKIVRIELLVDGNTESGCNWYLYRIGVYQKSTDKMYPFPVLQWIKANKIYSIQLYNTSLPQDDVLRDERAAQLKNVQENYQLSQKIPDGPIQALKVPSDEQFSFSHEWDIGTIFAKLQLSSYYKEICLPSTFKTIKDMDKVFDGKQFIKPESADLWDCEEEFGFQRLAGANPGIIELVTKIPDKFPVTDPLLLPHLSGLTIQQAIERKRLFIVDHYRMDGIPCRKGLVLCAPVGLFFANDAGKLVPVAIQLNQKPGPNNPIFTPSVHKQTWTMVKLWFNNADSNYHESVTHLGLTHLLMEGMCLATHRNLAGAHPIYKLLVPHFLYLIPINSQAVSFLLSEGGWVDQALNCGKDGMEELVRRILKTWRLDIDGTLPENLKKRGLDDPSVLPNYHYRDDAMLTYNAIHKYVTDYVKLYYPNPSALSKDSEIQNWAKELVKPKDGSKGGMGYLGIPGNGELTDNSQLITIATSIIFTCSVAHAAINFTQYEEYAYPPKYPALMNGTPPTDVHAVTREKDIVNALADTQTMLTTMTFTEVLSLRDTQSLSNFEVTYIYDPEACHIVDQFREDLRSIHQTITERNKHRARKYPYLDPTLIPNAISI